MGSNSQKGTAQVFLLSAFDYELKFHKAWTVKY